MDKPQLDYNEYLRYVFAGGFGILTYLYLNPFVLQTLFDEKGTLKDSLFLVLLSFILGAFLYAIHRAMLYPICYKLNLVILRLTGQLKSSLKWWDFILTQNEVKKQDFRRWKQKVDSKSLSKNLLNWFAQVHFLYCCVWAMLISWLCTENLENGNFLTENWQLITGVFFIISLRNHYRSLLYDLDIQNQDEEIKLPPSPLPPTPPPQTQTPSSPTSHSKP